MPITKSQVISQFLRTFPDMEAQAEEYFDRAYRRLLGEVELVRTWVVAPLAAGQRDVLLSAELIEASRVVIATSGSPAAGYQGKDLSVVFDEEGPGCSLTTEGDGRWKVRLYPPSEVSSGPSGFPKLAVRGAFWVPIAPGDSMPESLLDPSVLTSRMKEMSSEDLDPASAAYYRDEADRKTGELRAWLTERVSGERGSLRPAWTFRSWRQG